MRTLYLGLAAVLLPCLMLPPSHAASIPPSRGIALDGRAVSLPADLPGRASILIVGFGRHSADATTLWEKRVRSSFADTPGVGFYDMPMLAEVPGLVRPMVLRSIRSQVPDVLKPNFVPLTTDLDAWKQAAGFTTTAPDAAYVLLVERGGNILWQTHQPYSPQIFDQLADAARKLAAQPH